MSRRAVEGLAISIALASGGCSGFLGMDGLPGPDGDGDADVDLPDTFAPQHDSSPDGAAEAAFDSTQSDGNEADVSDSADVALDVAADGDADEVTDSTLGSDAPAGTDAPSDSPASPDVASDSASDAVTDSDAADGNGCMGVSCSTAPSSTCTSASVLRSFSAPGTCSAGTCSYPASDVTCPHGCSSGSCNANPCAGVACNTPPAATCVDASTRRTYAGSGTCSGGACSYASSDSACSGPPAPSCANATTRRTHTLPGVCASGTCNYVVMDTPCNTGEVCASGACVAQTCPGIVVDWNWNTGTAPTGSSLSFGGVGAPWQVGVATAGPSDGLAWLATRPAGSYAPNLDSWVRLPPIDLSANGACTFRLTVELWVQTEVASKPFDGGNLQFTTDIAGVSGWHAIDSGSMGYDGSLSSLSCDSSCWLFGQPTWANVLGVAKTGTYTAATPPGSTLNLRFTFHSDGSNSKAGIYVRRILVEATA